MFKYLLAGILTIATPEYKLPLTNLEQKITSTSPDYRCPPTTLPGNAPGEIVVIATARHQLPTRPTYEAVASELEALGQIQGQGAKVLYVEGLPSGKKISSPFINTEMAAQYRQCAASIDANCLLPSLFVPATLAALIPQTSLYGLEDPDLCNLTAAQEMYQESLTGQESSIWKDIEYLMDSIRSRQSVAVLQQAASRHQTVLAVIGKEQRSLPYFFLQIPQDKRPTVHFYDASCNSTHAQPVKPMPKYGKKKRA